MPSPARLSLAALAAALAVSLATGRAQNRVPLVTGKAITPQGTQTPVGSFPANMLLSPDGRYVVVANTGFRQFLSALSAEDGRVVSQIEMNGPRKDDPKKKQGMYYGLAFGPEEGAKRLLYVSHGSADRVGVFTLDAEGRLADTGRVLLNAAPNHPQEVAGIALGSDGRTLYAANNHTSRATDLKGSLSILDAAGNAPARKVTLPGFPFAVASLTQGPHADRKVYVTSERDGVVSVVDPRAGKVTRNIRSGDHPIALLLNPAQDRLYVANAGSDTVSVVDTARDRVTDTILLRPDDARGLPGATPTGLALSPDGGRLYVTLADMNAVAIVNLREKDFSKLAGYIPVGWYPTAVAATRDGKRLLVANAKGVNTRNPNGKPAGPDGRWGQYIQDIIEGTVTTLDLPGDLQLRALTEQTLENNLRPLSTFSAPLPILPKGIEHVIYIIKENRTYDQVLGDMTQGNGDPSLCLFPREVTPNQHALAERFVLLDNFYVCAEVSADGWDWSVSGMISEYTARNAPYNYSGRGRSYDFEGTNNGVAVDRIGLPDVARAPGGYIWDQVAMKGLSYRNYGFYVSFADMGTRGKEGGKTGEADNVPTKKALEKFTDLDFREYDLAYADSDAWVLHNTPAPKQTKSYGRYNAPSRFSEWKREFDRFVQEDRLPRFMMVRFPRDHTAGTSPGMSSPRAMAADNDFAVGQLVEAVSRSKYWMKTAIFIVEDDAQAGYDHVDAHRSTAYVISPYIRKGTVDHRFYNTDSVLRTMGLLLGLPPMCQYDAIAPPFAVFGDAPDNDAPFEAILPARRIVGEFNKPTAYRAQDSARMVNLLKEESMPDEALNDILWRSIRGRHVPNPPVRYGLRLHAEQEDD